MSWSTAKGLLLATINLNVLKHIVTGGKNNRDWSFSASDKTSWLHMLISMFSHNGDSHLFWNMFFLYTYGLEVFDTPRQAKGSKWKNPWAFVFIYFVSGLGAFVGVIVLAKILSNQLESEIESTRSILQNVTNEIEFTFSMEKDSNVCSASLNDLFVLINELRTKIAYHVFFSYAPRVGASGAIFGLMGARYVTAHYSPEHEPLSDGDMHGLAARFVTGITQTPWTLNRLILYRTATDHAAHIFGLLIGMATTAVWLKWGGGHAEKETEEKRGSAGIDFYMKVFNVFSSLRNYFVRDKEIPLEDFLATHGIQLIESTSMDQSPCSDDSEDGYPQDNS